MSGKSASQRNIVEQIDELRQKMQLLEGDRKAYYESAEQSMKQNREKIAKLRKDNKDLRKLKSEKLAADEQVVSKGLEDNPVERNALRSKPGSVAIVVMDEKVGDRINALNSAKYQTKKKQERLQELKTQNKSNDSGDSSSNNQNESDDAHFEHKLRSLENRLDKANLKCKEAEHIQKTYLQIKAKLEDEHKTFENTLDDMENDINRMKVQLKELKTMRDDAQIARDNAKAELEKQEKEIYTDRRRRELEIQKVRKEAEEKRVQAQIIQRRIDARQSMTGDDLTMEQRQQLGAGEEEHERIRTYEEAFRVIKEATGVSDTQEVVLRFENQGDTQHHLEQLKSDNEKQIELLKEERDALQLEFQQMKYSGEASLSSGQRLLEDYQNQVTIEEDKKEVSQARLEKCSKILTDVKSGIEHLSEKLKTLKTTPSDTLKTKSSNSDEAVLDQMNLCEEKLLKLLEDLNKDLESHGRDINEVSKEMEEEEFHNTNDMKLPSYNTRVKLPAASKDIMYDDEDASGEDEDALTRQGLKKQSQQIVDAKTRRRPGKRKKNKVAK